MSDWLTRIGDALSPVGEAPHTATAAPGHFWELVAFNVAILLLGLGWFMLMTRKNRRSR
jgi:hypothetical protein